MCTKKEKKYILAHDHGTSGSKAALVSTTGQVVGFEFEEVPLYLPSQGAAEQDPDDWWNALKNTVTRLLEKNLVPIDDIVGFCNTSQWSGTVPVDKDGNHLYNGIIWMDTRGAPYILKQHKALITVSGYSLRKMLKWIRIAGGGPTASGKDPIAHILWLRNEKPDIYEKTYKFLEVQDFINLKMTGKVAASTVSIQLHWITDIRDINNISYSQKLIDLLDLNREQYPELKLPTDVLGPIKPEVADELGLNKNVKVIMGAPDIPAAAIGSGAVNDYEGHIYIGTSSWAICHVPFKKADPFHNMGSLPSAIPGKYMFTNEQEIAGGCLSYLRDKILYHKDDLLNEECAPDIYKIFDRIAENVEAGSNRLIFTPWLYGERGPVDNHSIRGGLYNISLETTREHLIRAVLEGVAYNSRWLCQYVEKNIKRELNPINLIGGGAQSDVWCQIYADVLNRTIRQVKNPIQANARGAAFIGAVGLGFFDFKDIPKHIEYANIYKPNPENREIYDTLFEEFVNIYENNKDMYERLNSLE
ncbi:MAG: xylulokinase [Promethearchaeia archaeon]